MKISYSVECMFSTFFGAEQWTDLTSRLGQMSINRGRESQFDVVSPGLFTCVMDNDDGALTPGFVGSPYYPNVKRGVPIRVTAAVVDKNMMDNPGLTTSILPWEKAGDVASVTLSTPTSTQPTDDGFVGKITHITQNNPLGAGAGAVVYGFEPGQQYTFSIDVKPGIPAFILIPGVGFGSGTSGTGWQRISYTFTALYSVHTIQLASTNTTAGQIVEFSAPQLEKNSTATAFDKNGAFYSRRFTGKVYEWPLTWAGGTFGMSKLTAGDIFRTAGQKGNLHSFLIEETFLDDPLTLLPLKETSDATSVGNLGSYTASGEILQRGSGGTIDFGNGTGPPADGSSSMTLMPFSSTAGYYLRVPLNVYTTNFAMECWINSSVASTTLLDASNYPVGSAYEGQSFTLSIDSAKKLRWRSDTFPGTDLLATSPNIVADGQTHHIVANYEQTGAVHRVTLFVDGAQVVQSSYSQTWAFLTAKYLHVGGSTKLPMYTGTINHVAVYNSILSADRIKAHYDAGWLGFAGENSSNRISRLASYIGLDSLNPSLLPGFWYLGTSHLGSETILAKSELTLQKGKASVYGQSTGGDSAMSAMLSVGQSEGGIVYARREGLLAFTNRSDRYNRPRTLVLDAQQETITSDLEYEFDDSDYINEIIATTQNGSSLRLFNPAAIDSVGLYSASIQLLDNNLENAYQTASWQLGIRIAETPRVKQVGVKLYSLPESYYAQVLTMDIANSTIELVNLPSPPAPTTSVKLFVEGYTETVDADEITFELHTSSAENFEVWQMGMDQLGSGTKLAW